MYEALRAFETGQRETRLPAPAIIGPLLGLVYFFVLPMAVIIACLVVGGLWVKRRLLHRSSRHHIPIIRW